LPRGETVERRGGAAAVLRLDAKCPMIDDDLDDGAAAVLGLELLSRTEERVEGMPLQPMANSRTGGRATVPRMSLLCRNCEPSPSRRNAAVPRRRGRPAAGR
jgi:hypothetical protein